MFLGGSCNPTTWRDDLAIPFLKENSVTYYNPQVSNWRPELIEIEDQAKQVQQLQVNDLRKILQLLHYFIITY